MNTIGARTCGHPETRLYAVPTPRGGVKIRCRDCGATLAEAPFEVWCEHCGETLRVFECRACTASPVTDEATIIAEQEARWDRAREANDY